MPAAAAALQMEAVMRDAYTSVKDMLQRNRVALDRCVGGVNESCIPCLHAQRNNMVTLGPPLPAATPAG